ncbi:MAG: hypothetical protein KAH21_13290, partial [Spirochaetaceae bacterium]|nr:hypothetical protein [Spirochaetaceae bacterium]
PVSEFSLGLVKVFPDSEILLKSGRGPLIVLVMDGEIKLKDGIDELKLNRGSSAFLPWNALNVKLSGSGSCVIAEVGSGSEE